MVMMTLYESQHSNREGKTLSDYTPKKKIVSLYSMPGKAHGQRSLVGYSTWGRKESDTTERLHFHFHFPWLKRSADISSNYLSVLIYAYCVIVRKSCSHSMFLFLNQRNWILLSQNSPQLKKHIIISNILSSLSQVKTLFSIRFSSFNSLVF